MTFSRHKFQISCLLDSSPDPTKPKIYVSILVTCWMNLLEESERENQDRVTFSTVQFVSSKALKGVITEYLTYATFMSEMINSLTRMS